MTKIDIKCKNITWQTTYKYFKRTWKINEDTNVTNGKDFIYDKLSQVIYYRSNKRSDKKGPNDILFLKDTHWKT